MKNIDLYTDAPNIYLESWVIIGGQMRLIIKFIPDEASKYDSVNKHTIQGFIYSLLKNTPYSSYHDSGGFKYFSFSNIFPVSDFKRGYVQNV